MTLGDGARSGVGAWVARAGAVAFCLGLAAAGFVGVALAWRGAAATLLVPLQTPYLVSGGIGGIALVTTGLFLAAAYDERLDRATDMDDTAALVDELAAVVDAIAGRAVSRGIGGTT